MACAKAYYERQLLINYGIVPFANLIVLARRNEKKALMKNQELIQRKWFKNLRIGVSITVVEREQIERVFEEKADQIWEFKCKK